MHTTRTAREVSERLRKKVAEAGVSSVFQYIADLLALHVGLPDDVRELNQEVLQLPTSA